MADIDSVIQIIQEITTVTVQEEVATSISSVGTQGPSGPVGPQGPRGAPGGGWALAPVVTTTPYSASDSFNYFQVNSASEAIIFNLWDANLTPEVSVRIKILPGGADDSVTVVPFESQQINAQSNFVLSPGELLEITSINGEWDIS
jgi:hypothetical protein